jgi:dTDP-4-amino-4,6-dideoxygalactose transaminase
VGDRALSILFPGRTLHLYSSGTAALAIALQDARLRHRSSRPEAILPAYGCPQLVSACLYAKVRPRVVDVAPGEWGYAPQALRAALGPDTVAILAVDLLGVGDQAAELLPRARENGSFLIQDSAQQLPGPESGRWHGDYVVLSFGRGKPLNLLRGGALAVPTECPLLADAAEMTGIRARLKDALLGSRMAAIAFNTMTHPHVYELAARLPTLKVGQTTFEPFEQAVRLPPAVWRQVAAGYETYVREPRELPWASVLPEWGPLGIRPLTCSGPGAPAATRRLRLALLADEPRLRDSLVTALNRRGLGASIMYGASLDRIAAIPPEVSSQGPFPNATALADRLLTLPTHRFVSAAVVRNAHECVLTGSSSMA